MSPVEVVELKKQLTELGFNLLFDVGDQPTAWLRHAIREFQIYARLPRVAKVKQGSANEARWLDRLEATNNSKRYTGQIDGIYDRASVQPILDHWTAAKYRCPVVAEIYIRIGKAKWSELGEGSSDVRGNYWRYDDPRIKAFVKASKRDKPYGELHVRICDLTGQFEEEHKASVMSGRIFKHHVSAAKGKPPDVYVGGYVANSPLTMTSTAEVTPKNLIGKEWADLNDQARRTFRVIRAVSEHECYGYLESINGYDDAWMSQGPCHWTLALAVPGKAGPDDDANPGELPAFIAYWAATETNDSNAKLIQPFGVVPKPTWTNGKPPSKPGGACSYTGRLHWMSGPIDGAAEDGPISKVEDLNWIRTTHWFWRFLALARNVKSFRQRQWHMTRIRLRDILAYEIDPSDRPIKDAGSNTVAVSKLITSEVGVALLLRCHIRKSGFMAQKKLAHPSLRLALAFANIAEKDPAKWKTAEEAVLIEGLLASAAVAKLPADVATKLKKLTIDRVHEMRAELATLEPAGDLLAQCRKLLSWPDRSQFEWGRKGAAFKLPEEVATPALRSERGSFQLDKDNLPT
ncbi:hypothetical protein SAMN05216248_1046 [Pseudomonas simiae]|uniref:hypothetical protein n=1 Tax=Pseudomonas simiae TaxID=321846 RepID=UPI00084D8C07|nr:hypothetical protein [Pseudomonas simiae]SFB27618.1 hypothetical protein SAMN05216248_1046 [Pseudomonas simiae]